MHATQERWLSIPGYEGIYEVSDHGRVRGLDREINRGASGKLRIHGQILKPQPLRRYRAVRLKVHGRKRVALIHRLVLEAFVGPCPEGMEACHWDGDPTNNRVENLRWDTRSANARDRVRHGTHNMTSKRERPRGHLLEGDNLVPSRSKLGHRVCLACSRASARANRQPGLDLQSLSDDYYARIVERVA